jgi:hypothetical protein
MLLDLSFRVVMPKQLFQPQPLGFTEAMAGLSSTNNHQPHGHPADPLAHGGWYRRQSGGTRG